MINRIAVVLLLSAGLVLSGVRAPVAGADVVPPTVGEHLDGLPLGEDPTAFAERLDEWRAQSEQDDSEQDDSENAAGTSRTHEVAAAAAIRSQPVRTPIPFSMVGFEIPTDAEVGFRTSADGQTWTGWQWAPALGASDGPDPGTSEAVAAAAAGTRSEGYWVGEASWLQVRVLNGRPEDVGVDLIDSMGLSRSLAHQIGDAVRAAIAPTPDRAAAAPDRPAIVSRQEWGADESLRRESPDYATRVRMGVVHHTATSNAYTRDEAPGVVRGIYRYHTANQGWSDIGYNILIDRFGTVYEGRYGGLESAVIGAHARDWNTGSFGVSVIGCFDSQACAAVPGGGESMPSAVEEALVDVLSWKLDVHSIDVEGTVSRNGTTKPALAGHRDVGQTACPGDRIYSQLDALRGDIRDRQDAQGGVVVDPGVAPADVAVRDGTLDDDISFSARLRPPGEWQLRVSGEDGRVVHAASGAGDTAAVRWSGAGGLQPGTYTYAFASVGRRTATGAFEVSSPCDDAFCDLDGSVHAEAILRLHDRGIVQGCAEERFCPSGRVTRGQMATMTARALEASPERTDHFADVPPDHPHADGINALYERGVIEGNDGRFFPDRQVRRDQMATFLHNAFAFSASGRSHFRDVEGNTHEAAINALADHEVTRGDGNGRYMPERPIRRDQIASLLDRAIQAAR